MNQNPISSDDPRLTLYALGEMEPRERAEFEQLLQADAAARQAVEEIQAAAATITSALEHEPVEVAPKPVARILRFPQLYFTITSLAAACFAVFFVIWQNNYTPKEATHLIEVPLRSAPNETAALEAADAVELPVAGDSVPAPSAVVANGYDLREISERAMAKGEAEGRQQAYGGQFSAEAKMKAAARTSYGYIGGGAGSVIAPAPRDFNTEAYGYRKDNDFAKVADQPLSTFSIDVDTASYANVRRFLSQGQRPPADAVRIEELVNYFPYRYAPPAGDLPFAAHLEVASAPWAPEHRLVRIGLKGCEVSDAARPPANLVFLLDVSGSMHAANKLPLVKQSLRLLVEKLRPDDRVAIAVYAGASGLALPSTSASRKAEILDAIDRLEAGGSTNGAMGIQLAYDLAKANFVPDGVNRVILATDGDFNVGVTSEGELVRLVQEKAQSGVFLSVLGFGMGNLQDHTLESLADKGNGHYAYIDSLAEARKTLVEQAGGTLLTIAKDVKVQVEFNPAVVAAYRLIGYENRLLAKEDFNNDAVDAGDIGAGHTVTALYEVVPVGVELPATGSVDALKYQTVKTPNAKIQTPNNSEMLTVKIRYKEPAGEESRKLEFPLRDTGAGFANASPDFKFAAAVAAFGLVLRDSPHKGASVLADVAAWGRAGLDSDAGGYRTEFISLVGRAQSVLQ
ncbi:MAG: von Willebrand factor type A domain-containing protein [Lacunisphaera sp.]|nr:von Willebrand factor type A domain-containing protein [Lacunisphaera sp.]